MPTRQIRAALAALIASVLVCAFGSAPRAEVAAFSEWGTPENLGPVINTAGNDSGPCISRDGLTLYFNSDSRGGYGGLDIFASQRASVHEPWGTPQNVGPNVNDNAADNAPYLSPDGHWLYFQSTRPGFGGADLYVTRRRNSGDNFAWQPARNLGEVVNTSANEGGPVYFEDDATGVGTLYFFSTRPGVAGGVNIFASTRQPDDTWSTPLLVEEVSSAYLDSQPALSRDGLELFVSSNRTGSYGLIDIWVATRESTASAWSIPVNAGPIINLPTPYFQGRPSLSFDGTELYFYAYRPDGYGAQDLYVSRRVRLRD